MESTYRSAVIALALWFISTIKFCPAPIPTVTFPSSRKRDRWRGRRVYSISDEIDRSGCRSSVAAEFFYQALFDALF
jgi:hypothetical protein